MRRVMSTAAIALAAAALGYLAGGPRSASARAPTGVEYKVLVVDFDEYKESEEYKALEKELRSPWRAQFAFHERVLGREGQSGWELVHVAAQKTPAQTIFYLTRGGR